jgi:hypothetical protein
MAPSTRTAGMDGFETPIAALAAEGALSWFLKIMGVLDFGNVPTSGAFSLSSSLGALEPALPLRPPPAPYTTAMGPLPCARGC